MTATIPVVQERDLLSQAALLSEPFRCRLLLVLERHELTVGELCAVLQAPQSTVSRHLKLLRQQGWIWARKEASSAFYASRIEALDDGDRELWMVLRQSIQDQTAVAQDRERVVRVLEQRREGSRAFFEGASQDWDSLRVELFGERFDLVAGLALLGGHQVVGDLGCGTGSFSRSLAPWVRQVIAVDSSEAMLATAGERLAEFDTVELRRGSLEELPVADGELDSAILLLALHHVADPRRVLDEARRALRPGGSVVVVDMQAHDRQQYRQEMGHVWLGFSQSAVRKLFADSDWQSPSYRRLPPDLAAKGPELFVARAFRPLEKSQDRFESSTTSLDEGGVP